MHCGHHHFAHCASSFLAANVASILHRAGSQGAILFAACRGSIHVARGTRTARALSTLILVFYLLLLLFVHRLDRNGPRGGRIVVRLVFEPEILIPANTKPLK